ncbi:class I SAM-dependent methyltransferase [Sorangium sp. So ce1078]|uniref:class I SAM-dependent methyltransferase n=1 Tax=Sorangium sp. So ce1078 TaxID=3133329 RepID=UPI003F644950
MKNEATWRETKYVKRGGRLRASTDLREVVMGSRLCGDCIARLYEEYLPRYARGATADLGCGKVPLYGAYRPHVSSVTCVDWGNTPFQTTHLDFECDLNGALPLEDASFDTLILSDVLEHIARPEPLWAEMARILRPGGVAFVNTPFFYWVHGAPYDYYRYTEFAHRRFAELAGFEVLVLERIGGLVEVACDVFAKSASAVPVVGNPVAALAQSAVGLWSRSSTGRKVAHWTGRKFPLGYFMVARRLPVPQQS